MKRLLVIPGLLAVSAVVALILTSLLLVIYPGSFRWTAPHLCPSGQTDAYVVRYSQATSDGSQSTNFTLFCMDERGEFTEVGSWRPLGLVFAGMTAALFALIVLRTFWRFLRGSSEAAGTPAIATSAGTTTTVGDGSVGDGSVAGIPDGTRAQAQALIHEGKMIQAIKQIREDAGLGLKEAKDVAEALRDGRYVPSTGSSPLT